MTHAKPQDLITSLLSGRSDDEQVAVSKLIETGEGSRVLFDQDPILVAMSAAAGDVAPSQEGRARLLGALRTISRFARFAETVSQMLSVSRELGQRLLDGIDASASWTDSPWEGVRLYHLEDHLEGAPVASQAVVGFVRLAPGARFPTHRHLGSERALVVQGAMAEDDGTVVRVGGVPVHPAQSEHSFIALPGPDLIYLVIGEGGVQIGDAVLLPGDPNA